MQKPAFKFQPAQELPKEALNEIMVLIDIFCLHLVTVRPCAELEVTNVFENLPDCS